MEDEIYVNLMGREVDVYNLYDHFCSEIRGNLDFTVGIFEKCSSTDKINLWNKIVSDETHYFLEREGYTWCEDKNDNMFGGRFEDKRFSRLKTIDNNEYLEARATVKETLLMFFLTNYVEFRKVKVLE